MLEYTYYYVQNYAGIVASGLIVYLQSVEHDKLFLSLYRY